MATPVYLKSSSVASKVPSTSSLSLRELGVNTTDGILYLRQGTGVAGDIIIPVNPWRSSTGNTTAYNTYFTAGNVGIGKTNPSFALDVFGTSSFTAISAGNTIGASGQFLQSTGTGLTWASTALARSVTYQTATAGQTTFNVSYTAGSIDVYLNGSKLQSNDFTASNGTTVVLATPAVAGDNLEFDVYTSVNSANFVANAGSTSVPSYTFLSSTNTGLYLPATNTLGISTAGVEAVRIDGSRNVGIGITNPSDKLTVSGRIQIQQDAGSNNRLVFRGTPGSSYRWSMDNYQSGNTFRIFREDDATAANGFSAISLSSSGYLTGAIFGGGAGLYPAQQYFCLNSGLAGANSTAVQNPYGVSVTLVASTIYEFEAYFILTKTSGTGSHTFSTGFTGSATVNNMISSNQYFISTSSLPPFVVNANSGNVVFSAGNAYTDKFTWTGSLTASTITHAVLTKGTVSIATGGTFNPYYQLSGAPGTGYTTAAGSYYRIYPLGASGSNISQGSWA
jgi:hypothetical protein